MKGRAFLIGVVVLIAAAIVYNVQRERTHVYEDDAEHFKYGSIGSEPGVSLFSPVGGRLPPEWIFRVLPQVCTSMPSYEELGLIYEKEADGVTNRPLPSRGARSSTRSPPRGCARCCPAITAGSWSWTAAAGWWSLPSIRPEPVRPTASTGPPRSCSSCCEAQARRRSDYGRS